MRKKMIVDFRIAAAERDSLLTPEWKWPVKQETYDDSLREFVEWMHALPAQFHDKPELRNAFELIELDLLVDLTYLVGAWIEFSTAKKLDLDLIYGNDQQLYKLLVEDQLDGFSPVNDLRAARDVRLHKPIRRLYRLVRKTARNYQARIKGRPRIHSIGINPLLLELTGGAHNLLHISFANIAVQRLTTHNNPIINELAREIQQQLSRQLADIDHAPTERLNSHIQKLATNHLNNGWSDKDFKPEFAPNSKMTLFTGTGGGYLSRTLAHAFQKNGAKVIRTTHGGDSVLFDDPLWASTEIPFSDTYVTYGTKAAEITRDKVGIHQSIRRLNTVPSIVAAGSFFHQKIVDASVTREQIKTVHLITASFSGVRRDIPNVKSHDIVLLDWYRRLLEMIRAGGFRTIAKRHPKGVGSDIPIFEDVASQELRQMKMLDTLDQADAYVCDLVGTAFMEALCSLKPIVLIEIPNRQLTEEARTELKKSVIVIPATYNENNRITIEPDGLIDGLREPVDLEARYKFISDYLTSSGTTRTK